MLLPPAICGPSLPAGLVGPVTATGHAFIEVDAKTDELPLRCPAGLVVVWLHRSGADACTTSLLEDGLRTVRWPEKLDTEFVWGGCEHRAFSAIHRYLKKDVGLSRNRFVFYSHWHKHLSEEEITTTGAEAYLPQ